MTTPRITYMMFENAIRAIEEQQAPIDAWLNACPKGPMGLTSDEVKATAEWQHNYNRYHALAKTIQTLRKRRNSELGARVVNKITREIQQEKRDSQHKGF